MADALQDESDLCLLPHTVPWPTLAPAAAAPVASATTVPATNVTVAPSGNNPDTDDDEDEEMADEDDGLEPAPLVSLRSILIDKIVDLIYKAATIGDYYNDRIDELYIPDRPRNVVGPDGSRIEVDPAGMQLDASMIIDYAVKELRTAAEGLKHNDLQKHELEKLALSTCKAMGDIPVGLEWYLRCSAQAGNTEEDMAKLVSMQQAILDEFEAVGEDEDEMEEDE
ncbi:hypothetical protein KCU81_g7093, partial [Aureobasidium melanogenum]|uniref:Uncharacterized protein n=1 Tax=Aureobasidium melanogenum (strain CBS 110374) TaxID=1043003 RepID=A0A074WFR4_AURM1